MHVRERRRLQDALTAIRLNTPIAEAGWHLYPNGERYLREQAGSRGCTQRSCSQKP